MCYAHGLLLLLIIVYFKLTIMVFRTVHRDGKVAEALIWSH